MNITNAENNKYNNLICHFLNECDEVSFQLPGVDSNGLPLTDLFWRTYHNKTQRFMQDCLKHGGKKTCSNYYQGMKLGQYSLIINVKLFSTLKQMIMNTHLFEWLAHNGLPEDICLYANKTLRIFTCSHESDFFICNENKDDIKFLSDNQFEYRIIK